MAKGVGNPLIFKDSEAAKAAIMDSQKKEIAKLYQDWADEIGSMANYYAHKSTASAPLSERYYKEVQKQLQATSQQVSNEVYGIIKNNIYMVSDAVVKDNVKWLEQFGFSKDGLNAAFSYVPDMTVRNLVTGQIYEGGWNLSAKIWGNNEATLKDIYQVMAGGAAQQKPIYEIAKDLEKYVSPKAAKPWNLVAPDGKKIYPKQVDYNAQRLARTLTQHGYQQSFVAVTKNNPFITDYIWHANGSRACELCQARDGQHYAKNDLPLDHPNGMCVMEPTVSGNMLDQLADWFNSPDGTFPEIDAFAENFGYTAEVNQWDKWLHDAGWTGSKLPANFTEFAHSLTYEQQTAFLHQSGGSWGDAHPFQKMEQYYNQHFMQQNKIQVTVPSAPDLASLGKSKGKTFNYWYAKLDANQKEYAKKLKEQSGLTWQQFYEKHIYNGTAAHTASNTPKRATDLRSWISGMRKQTESEMLATEAKQFARMTNEQVHAIRTYTGSAYDRMNGYLRAVASGSSHNDAVLKSGIGASELEEVHRAIAGLKTSSLEKDVYLRRGTDLGDLAGFMPGNFSTNKGKLYGMSVSELNTMFAGTTGTYAGFTSTSSLYDRGFDGDVEIIFKAPAGTNATSVMSISRFGTGEGETLLNAGTKVIIEKIEESDGHAGSDIRVFMQIIK